MVIGLLATVITVSSASVIGIVAGFVGGRVDSVLMRITDFFLVLPTFVLALILAPIIRDLIGSAATELFGIRVTLFVIVVVIGITSWASTARIIRSQTLSLKERAFVDRARVIGAGSGHIMRRHILPNVVNLIVANAVLTFAGAVLTETTLSFIGLGRPVPAVVGPDPRRRAGGRRAGTRGVVVLRAARRLHRARGPRLHARRERPRRHPQPEAGGHADDRAPTTDRRSATGRAPLALPKQADPDAPLLVVENLKTHFTARVGLGPGGRRRQLQARPRRGARDRRRVRLRQDDDGALAGPAAAGERDDRRREASGCSGSTSCRSPRTRCGATAGARSRSSSRAR